MLARLALTAFIAFPMGVVAADEPIDDVNIGFAVTLEAPAKYSAGVAFEVTGVLSAQVGLPVIFETAHGVPGPTIELLVDGDVVAATSAGDNGRYRFELGFGSDGPSSRMLQTRAFAGTPVEASSRPAVTSIDRFATSLSIDPSVATLAVDATVGLQATASMSDGRDDNVTSLAAWISDDEAVATIEAGVVTAHAPGTATITATYQSVTATATITVV